MASSWNRLVLVRGLKHILLIAANVSDTETWTPLYETVHRLAREYAISNTGFFYAGYESVVTADVTAED
jgi:hypothetical protein